MNCLNVRALYGDTYQIGKDEAATRANKDPWLWTVKCKYGHIYPHSATELGFFCDSSNIMKRLHRDHPELRWTECDGEAIFYFTPDQFDIVAQYARPRKKRKNNSTPEHLKRLVEAGRNYRSSAAHRSAQPSMSGD